MSGWVVYGALLTHLAFSANNAPGQNPPPVSSQPALPSETAVQVLGQPGMSYPLPNWADGSGLARPSAIVFDRRVSPPRVYVADTGNHRVLGFRSAIEAGRVPSADLVIGQADLHSGLFNDEQASRSRLLLPVALAVDAQGNLYVADCGYNRITRYDRPFETDAVADGLYGQGDNWEGLAANADGPISAASLAAPSGLCIDAAGHLWVADADNNRVLCYLDPIRSKQADIVLGQDDFTHASCSSVSATSLRAPNGLACNGEQVIVADTGNNRVLLYDAPIRKKNRAAIASFGQDGSLTRNKAGCSPFNLNGPSGVAVANGSQGNDLYICDTGNNRVVRFALNDSPAAQPSGLWGQKDLRSSQANPDQAGPATLLAPVCVTVGADQTFWIVDRENHRVMGYPAAEREAKLVIGQINFRYNFGNRVDGHGFSFPRDVAIDRSVYPNRLYVCDFNNNRVLGYDSVATLNSQSEPTIVLGQRNADGAYGGCGPAGLREPSALAVDARGGLYVADRENNRVLWFDCPFESDTLADRVFGQDDLYGASANAGGISATSLNRPEGVAIDFDGNLYISDARNHRILRYNRASESDAVADMVWGQRGHFDRGIENAGGKCGPDTLCYPFKLNIRPDGKLVVADTGNHRVLMFDTRSRQPEQAVRVWGQGGDFTSCSDNRGGCSATSLSGPEAVALHGNALWIADTANCRLLYFANAMSQGGQYDRADAVWGQRNSFNGRQMGMGVTSEHNLWFPSGFAFDSDGNLYVADREQSRVLIYKIKR